jgi:hypothetical protein
MAKLKLGAIVDDKPVRLTIEFKFADRAGEILTASPRGMQAPPMPFRFYI